VILHDGKIITDGPKNEVLNNLRNGL